MQSMLGASLIAIALPMMAVAENSDSNVEAITGGSSLAITGGSAQAITGGSSLAITGGSTTRFLLAGPVESLNLAEGVFGSLGQTISMPARRLSVLSLGDYVMVSGRISGAGAINADTVILTGHRYIPGASEVFVTGIPTSVDIGQGTALVGGLRVDYTPSLGGSDFGGIGAAITVIGTQPALGGMMIGDRVLDRTELFLRRD
jgi:hypothetical protein